MTNDHLKRPSGFGDKAPSLHEPEQNLFGGQEVGTRSATQDLVNPNVPVRESAFVTLARARRTAQPESAGDSQGAEAPVQRKAANGAGASGPPPSAPAGVEAAATGGAALDGPVRAQMEASFDTDFGDVRVHQGPQAEAMDARAFTRGADVHFRPGEYAPDTAAGRELLGHELAHVVQQRAGRVAVPQGKSSPVNADPTLEAEADAAGAAASRGERVSMDAAGGRAAAALPGAVQRKRSSLGSTKRNEADQDSLRYKRDEHIAALVGLLVTAPKSDRDAFNAIANHLSGLVSGTDVATLNTTFQNHPNNSAGITLDQALVNRFGAKHWRHEYLKHVLENGEPTAIDKLALLLGLITHTGDKKRNLYRPGDAGQVLALLEGKTLSDADLWKIFNLGEYEELRVAFTRLERTNDLIEKRVHALRRARDVVVPAARPQVNASPQKASRNARDARTQARVELEAAVTAQEPSAAVLHDAAVAFSDAVWSMVQEMRPDAGDDELRAAADLRMFQFVRDVALPAQTGTLRKALEQPSCRLPILEALHRKIAQTAVASHDDAEVEHLAAIVLQHGGHQAGRDLVGVNKDKLIAAVKGWRGRASDAACAKAAVPGSAFDAALDTLRTSKAAQRGLSERDRDYLMELVSARQAPAPAAQPGATQKEIDQAREDQMAAKELGALVEREKTKEKHRHLGTKNRYRHTKLNAGIDGMTAKARTEFLLDKMSPQDRQTFEDPKTSAAQKQEIFEATWEAFADELKEAGVRTKHRAALEAKFRYVTELGPNYLRLCQLTTKQSDSDFGKKCYSAVTKLAGDELYQVRRDPQVMVALDHTGAYRSRIAEILGLPRKDEELAGQALHAIDGASEAERATAARDQAEHSPAHWARLIDYEIAKHSTLAPDANPGRASHVNRLTIHVGRLYSLVHRAQMAARRQHAGEGREGGATTQEQTKFVKAVWDALSKHSKEFIKDTRKTAGMSDAIAALHDHLINNTPITVVERIEVADRGLHTRKGEMEQALADVSGEELLYEWSNFPALEKLVAERQKATTKRDKQRLDGELAEFELDLKPEVQDELRKRLTSRVLTTKPTSLVKLVAAARRRLADAVSKDSAFQQKLSAAYQAGQVKAGVDAVLAANLRAMALLPEEALRHKGLQWQFLSVLSDATTLKAAELQGAHRAMDQKLGKRSGNRDLASRSANTQQAVGADLEKIEGLEGDWKSLAEDFEKVRAKYNSRLKRVIEIVAAILITAATAGIGSTIAAGAWALKALMFSCAAVVKKAIGLIIDRALEGGFDARTGDVMKESLLFALEQGVSFAAAYGLYELGEVYKQALAHSPDLADQKRTVTETLTPKSGSPINVSWEQTVPKALPQARIASDAAYTTATLVAKTLVVEGPQKLVRELVASDSPLEALRKNPGHEIATYALERLKQTVYTFGSLYARGAVSDVFAEEKTEAANAKNKAQAEHDAVEQRGLSLSPPTTAPDPTVQQDVFGMYGVTSEEEMYEHWHGDPTEHASDALDQAQADVDQKQGAYDLAQQRETDAETSLQQATNAYQANGARSQFERWLGEHGTSAGSATDGQLQDAPQQIEAERATLKAEGYTDAQIDDMKGAATQLLAEHRAENALEQAQQDVTTKSSALQTAKDALDDAKERSTYEDDAIGRFRDLDADKSEYGDASATDDATKKGENLVSAEQDEAQAKENAVVWATTGDVAIRTGLDQVVSTELLGRVKITPPLAPPGKREKGESPDSKPMISKLGEASTARDALVDAQQRADQVGAADVSAWCGELLTELDEHMADVTLNYQSDATVFAAGDPAKQASRKALRKTTTQGNAATKLVDEIESVLNDLAAVPVLSQQALDHGLVRDAGADEDAVSQSIADALAAAKAGTPTKTAIGTAKTRIKAATAYVDACNDLAPTLTEAETNLAAADRRTTMAGADAAAVETWCRELRSQLDQRVRRFARHYHKDAASFAGKNAAKQEKDPLLETAEHAKAAAKLARHVESVLTELAAVPAPSREARKLGLRRDRQADRAAVIQCIAQAVADVKAGNSADAALGNARARVTTAREFAAAGDQLVTDLSEIKDELLALGRDALHMNDKAVQSEVKTRREKVANSLDAADAAAKGNDVTTARKHVRDAWSELSSARAFVDTFQRRAAEDAKAKAKADAKAKKNAKAKADPQANSQ